MQRARNSGRGLRCARRYHVADGRMVDLNADLGESFGAYTLGADAQVMQLITSANVACAMHAGDPRIMDDTVQLS